ncbi:MAG: glycosyltransferase family 2 protein [Deltaproteobacteria bacterium]|nr:glycosyltransferase family 2 protein [Deltaproteobacteria bacterium]
MTKCEVSIIIPAYNEGNVIRNVISEIKSLYPDYEVLVINDGSTDDTGAAANEAGAIVYSHPYNIGNGAAVKTGIRIASGEILVLMDGDGQHRPEDIANLLKHLPEFDMVVGARHGKKDQASLLRNLGNKIYNRLASYVTRFPVEDLTSGFRAIKADIARNYLYLLPNTFSYPTTLTLGVLRSGRSLKYVRIKTSNRKKGKSKVKLFRDGVRFFLIIIKICTLYSPLRVFLPVSAIMFLLGLSYYLYTFLTWGRFTNMSALLFMTSVLIFMMGLISEQICQMRFERSEGG